MSELPLVIDLTRTIHPIPLVPATSWSLSGKSFCSLLTCCHHLGPVSTSVYSAFKVTHFIYWLTTGQINYFENC